MRDFNMISLHTDISDSSSIIQSFQADPVFNIESGLEVTVSQNKYAYDMGKRP